MRLIFYSFRNVNFKKKKMEHVPLAGTSEQAFQRTRMHINLDPAIMCADPASP